MTKPFLFLDLPPELRTCILIELVQKPQPIPLASHYPRALLLVSSQIYVEVLALYFTTNIFSLTLHRHNEILAPVLSSPLRFRIRSLRVNIDRWGANDFFVKTFAPVLEEMILKGSLRRLEVGIREGSAKRLEGGIGREQENWVVLKRILRDPYLELARLLGVRVRDGVLEEGRDVSWLIAV